MATSKHEGLHHTAHFIRKELVTNRLCTTEHAFALENENFFEQFTFDDSLHFQKQSDLTLTRHLGFSTAFVNAYVDLFLEKHPLHTVANLSVIHFFLFKPLT
jgi:hypothetical protein